MFSQKTIILSTFGTILLACSSSPGTDDPAGSTTSGGNTQASGTTESGTTESGTAESDTGGPSQSTTGGGDVTSGPGEGSSGGPDSGTVCYEEELHPEASIEDIVAEFGGSEHRQQVLEAVTRVWPGGRAYLEQNIDHVTYGNFTEEDSWSENVFEFSRLMHEMHHVYYGVNDGTVYLNEGLIYELGEGSDANGFPRGEIYDLIPDHFEAEGYVDIYFTGEQGQWKLNDLLDEWACYTAELPISAIYDKYTEKGKMSIRDGTAAFAHFVQLYLRVAKEDHPEYFEEMKNDPLVVGVIRDNWLRMHYYLEMADNYENAGIDDAIYRAELYKPENLVALEELVGAKLGESHCTL